MKVRIVCMRGILLLILILVVSSMSLKDAFADDLSLVVDGDGLELKPVDPLDINRLFNIEKMTPGDKISAKVTASSSYPYNVSLSVKVVNLHDQRETYDLLDKLKVRVLWKDEKDEQHELELIVRDKDVPTDMGDILVDEFGKGKEIEFTFEVELPIMVGNDYQDKKASLKWIFIGESTTTETTTNKPKSNEPTTSSPPGTTNTPSDYTVDITSSSVPLGSKPGDPDVEVPKTGESMLWYQMSIGLGLIVAGLIATSRKREKEL